MNPALRHALIGEIRGKLQRFDAVDDCLTTIRNQGGGKIDCIYILRAASRMSLEAAKRAVHFSSVSADAKERDEQLWEEFETPMKDA